jgi:hypothetical protein
MKFNSSEDELYNQVLSDVSVNVAYYSRWFSSDCVDGFIPATLVSSTNKTDCHDITEILLKVVLNTINQTKPSDYLDFHPKNTVK